MDQNRWLNDESIDSGGGGGQMNLQISGNLILRKRKFKKFLRVVSRTEEGKVMLNGKMVQREIIVLGEIIKS